MIQLFVPRHTRTRALARSRVNKNPIPQLKDTNLFHVRGGVLFCVHLSADSTTACPLFRYPLHRTRRFLIFLFLNFLSWCILLLLSFLLKIVNGHMSQTSIRKRWTGGRGSSILGEIHPARGGPIMARYQCAHGQNVRLKQLNEVPFNCCVLSSSICFECSPKLFFIRLSSFLPSDEPNHWYTFRWRPAF